MTTTSQPTQRRSSVARRLRLVDGFELRETQGAVLVRGPDLEVALRCSTPVGEILRRLGAEAASEDELTGAALAIAGVEGMLTMHSCLLDLSQVGALVHVVTADGRALAELVPLHAGFHWRRQRTDGGRAFVLSRFAYLRRGTDGMTLESPLGSATVRFCDPAVAGLFAAMDGPTTAAALVGRSGIADEDTAHALLALLLNAAVLVDADDRSEDFDDPVTALGSWEFHDLLFHARSRLGRHHGRYGGTFHRRGILAPPPLRPTGSGGGATVALPRPDLATLQREDPPFAAVAEERRSRRSYAASPLSVDQLGELLYRSARVQQLLTTGPDDLDYSLRPSPGGGAIHELEIYPVVAACEGLSPGVYHYDPVDHTLALVREPDDRVRELLELAWRTGDQKSRPQVYLAITARFSRLQWKYESMVYAVVLKNVGALYTTLYLAATAMGLAPCALGGGSSDLFAQIAELDYLAESQVGEFLVGSRGD